MGFTTGADFCEILEQTIIALLNPFNRHPCQIFKRPPAAHDP